MRVFCQQCGKSEELNAERWHCECGGAWEPLERSDFNPEDIKANNAGIWRYEKFFAREGIERKFSLGVGWSPLLPVSLNERQVYLKLEYLAPTSSFKDRGTEVEINLLVDQPIHTVIDDSSGNAGSSLAAYATRAELGADIFVPHYTSPNKIKQISIYGANVHAIAGVREDTRKAAQAHVAPGRVYASHAYHPAFMLGIQSLAWEIWEQLGGRAPDWMVMPVGQGVNLLGAWLGFRRLRRAGLIDKVPRMVAVQPELLNPISCAVRKNADVVTEVIPSKPSLAEGLAIAKPVRWKRILQAIYESGGTAISVSENEILSGQAELAQHGLYVEPTSAVVFQAIQKIFLTSQAEEIIVAPLTGSGLKGAPKID